VTSHTIKPKTSRGPKWLVDFPTGWIVEQRKNRVTARSPRDAELKFKTFVPRESGTDAETWIKTAADVDRQKGREVVAAKYGDFDGYETRFVSRGRLIHSWVLAAGDLPLDVTYKCDEADAGREEAELRAMLATLRRTGV
jgi:hypothetical protein